MTKGDIVLVRFPFSNLSVAKLRPALVLIKADEYGDVCLAFISSQIDKASDFVLRLTSEASGFSQTGLKTDSVVRLNKIVTLHQDLVVGRIGRLPRSQLLAVNDKLRAIFQL